MEKTPGSSGKAAGDGMVLELRVFLRFIYFHLMFECSVRKHICACMLYQQGAEEGVGIPEAGVRRSQRQHGCWAVNLDHLQNSQCSQPLS